MAARGGPARLGRVVPDRGTSAGEQAVTSCTSGGEEDAAATVHAGRGPGRGAPLSEELERSEGVIAPANPGVDPGMVKQPPDTGATATMPVIPPPGTLGGNPNVRPK